MGSVRTGLLVASMLFVVPRVDAGPYAPTPEVVGVTEVVELAPAEGLIDLATANDDAGQLAYVVADAAEHAEVHIVDINTGTEVRKFDVSALTAAPERLFFVGSGAKASVFVVARAADGDAMIGALYDAKGVQLRRFGPAASLAVIKRKGKPQILVRKVSSSKKGETVKLEVFQPNKKGKRIGKAKKLVLVGGANAKLGFTLNHWTDEGTVAVGIKEGEWSKSDDTRQPDVEARYDVLTGKMTTVKITSIIDHKKRFETLAEIGAPPPVFVRLGDDQVTIETWQHEQPHEVALDQSFELYDPKTLTWTLDDDGTMWVGLRVDPWNRPAIKRKKADLEYFDLFHVDPDGKAVREGRVLAPKKQFAMGAAGNHVWLIERNVGFDRGGKSLTIYQ